jgi:hypothetical protein
MEKITITLTRKEAYELWSLVSSSKDTGNEEWDKIMAAIEQKLDKKI